MVIDDEFKLEDKKRLETFKKYFDNEWIRQNEYIANREEILKYLPTEFEVVPCATMLEFQEKMNLLDVHAFFIDYRLDREGELREDGDFDKGSFRDVLHKIKEKCGKAPIYVYSSKWNDSSMNDLIEDFNVVFVNRIPNNVLTFRYFENAVKSCKLHMSPPEWGRIKQLEKKREQIWNAIATQRNHVPFQPSSPSGDIVILHISDLQFGDKKTAQNVTGMWNDMADKIHKFLARRQLEKVDLVVITGDIAMSGKPSEYKDAISQLQTLFKKLWGANSEEWKDRIIVVPGNHDFDINTCVLRYFKAENKDKLREVDFDKILEKINANKDKELQNDVNEYQRLGLQSFREFAYELTQDDIYILSENLDFINDKYSNWGIRFICLNSVYMINAKKTNFAGININNISSMCDEIDIKEEFFTIILTHHTLLSKEYLSVEEYANISNALNTLQRSLKAQIVMGGHRHINDTGDKSNSENKTLYTLEAASLRVEDKADAYERGYGLLTIKKDLKGADLQYFVFDKKDGVIKPGVAYPYTFA